MLPVHFAQGEVVRGMNHVYSTHFLLPVLVFILVTVLVLLELIVSASLFSLLDVRVAVMVCDMVGLFSLVWVTVTFVFGEPMEDMSVVIGFCWEATQASPAPRPARKFFIIFKTMIDK